MRLFDIPLFIEPLSNKEAFIVELALETMKIDFPSPKELIARKQAEKEAAKATTVVRATEAAQALISHPFPLIESSHKPLNVPEQPPAKKQKAGEKQMKKVAGKMKREHSREVVSKPRNEVQAEEEEKADVKVNLPLGTSLF